MCAAHEAPPDAAPVHFSILLVEDDCVTLKQVAAMLKKYGNYSVTTAENGAIALELLRQAKVDGVQRYDLVLTDLLLPEVSGFELVSEVTGGNGDVFDVPIVVMSSQDSRESVLQAFEAGAADYLIKPIRKNEVSTLWQHIWRNNRVRATAMLASDGSDEKAKDSSSAGVVQGISSGLSTAATDAQPSAGSGGGGQARGGADQEQEATTATTPARDDGARAQAKGSGRRAQSTGADAGAAAAAAAPLQGALDDDSGEGEPDDAGESAGGRDKVYGAALHFDIAGGEKSASPEAARDADADVGAHHGGVDSGTAAGGAAGALADAPLLRVRPAAQRPGAAPNSRAACELPPGLRELAQAATAQAAAAANGGGAAGKAPNAAAQRGPAGASSAAIGAAAAGDAAALPPGDGRSAFTAVTVFLPNNKAPGAAAVGTPRSLPLSPAAPAASVTAGDKAPGGAGATGGAPSLSPAAAAAAAAVAAMTAGGGTGGKAPRGTPGAGLLPDAVVQLIAVLATGRGGGAAGNARATAAALSSRLAALQSNSLASGSDGGAPQAPGAELVGDRAHAEAVRQAAVAKYLEKRKNRTFQKKVRYESRKRLAESRPRVRGQFVKAAEREAMAAASASADADAAAGGSNQPDGGAVVAAHSPGGARLGRSSGRAVKRGASVAAAPAAAPGGGDGGGAREEHDVAAALFAMAGGGSGTKRRRRGGEPEQHVAPLQPAQQQQQQHEEDEEDDEEYDEDEDGEACKGGWGHDDEELEP